MVRCACTAVLMWLFRPHHSNLSVPLKPAAPGRPTAALPNAEEFYWDVSW